MPHTPDAPSRAGADLDPSIRRFVREMGAAWTSHPPLSTVTPADARRIAEQVREPWTRGGPAMATIVEHHVPTSRGPVRVRAYHPAGGEPAGTLIYLHGGGWTLFSLDTHDRVMREYAGRAVVTVLGVEYALSPEARYPVALDQVCDVVAWAAGHGWSGGTDRGRLCLGGDSAGANLAVAACLRLRDAGTLGLAKGLVLNYGVFDRESSEDARRRFGGPGYMLGADEMDGFWRNYLADGQDATEPLVSPLRADLRGLPPTLLVVPECDLLTEQSLAMGERLRAAGTAVTLNRYPGATHSFLEAVSIAPLADRALDETATWLRALLNERRIP